MSPLEPLAPDQRAVVALVLQQRRSYEEIAGLLGIPVAAVRTRAHAGLAALAADNGLPDEVTGPLADYLLGQQGDRDAAATRRLLAESGPARAWAADVAARPPPPDRPRARPGRAARRARARGVAARRRAADRALGRGRRGRAVPRAARRRRPRRRDGRLGHPRDDRHADADGKANGTMTVYVQGDRLLFELVASDLPPSGTSSAYAIWLTGPGDKVRRLGFATVGANGRLGIQGPSDKDLANFPQLYASYARVVVSRETSQDAERPGNVLLTGKLPTGR